MRERPGDDVPVCRRRGPVLLTPGAQYCTGSCGVRKLDRSPANRDFHGQRRRASAAVVSSESRALARPTQRRRCGSFASLHRHATPAPVRPPRLPLRGVQGARDRGPPSRARHPPGARPSAATPRACWPATSSPSTRSSQRGSTVRKLLHEAGARARGLESGARLRGPRFGPPTGRSWPLRAREPPRARRSMVVLRRVVLLVLFLLRQVVAVLGGRTL